MENKNKAKCYNRAFDVDEAFSLFKENDLYSYKDIYSLLVLLFYRTFVGKNIQEIGTAINSYDRINYRATKFMFIKKLIIKLYNILGFGILWIKTFNKRDSAILMSQTFIKSNRYDLVKKQLLDVGFTGIVTINDVLQGSIHNIKDIRATLKGEGNDASMYCRPVFLFRNSLAGVKLQELAIKWADITLRMYDGQHVNPKEIQNILEDLGGGI